MDRRSAKARAARIDLSYFKMRHPFRRWRLWLSIAVPIVAVAWIAGADFSGRQTVFNPGPLSHSHAVFGNRCELCHLVKAGLLRRHVTDDACLTCHDGPKHQMTQAFTPACSTCHVEHRGVERIAEVPDSSCTQCHAQLRTAHGTPSVARTVTLFISNHPEFRAKLADARDPGTIKLNHAVHLAAGLKGPNGPVQMQCADCHRVNPNAGPWPYGTVKQVAMEPPIRERPLDLPYMLPIKYAEQCAACHSLEFDRRFGAEQVPHDKPDVVHKFLLERYRKLVADHPAAWHDNTPPEPRRIVAETPLRPAHNPDEWVEMQVAAAERLLWQKTCKECHTLSVPAAETALPEVPKSAIPARWMQHAAFNHSAHTLLECESCHADSRRSKETSDILLPSIATCRQCHRREQEIGMGADARCSECHVYHDWSQKRRVNAPFTIPQIRGSAAPPATPVASLR